MTRVYLTFNTFKKINDSLYLKEETKNMSSESLEIRHTKIKMAQYKVGNMVNELIQAALAIMLFYYYEAEIGLDTLLVGLGMIIYAVWDAINDPLIGYLTDRPYRFTKKWGRRFPWIVASFFPMLICFLLIFYPPTVSAKENPWILFGWLVFSTCSFDVFETFFTTNLFALYPDKFRSGSERLTVSAIGTYIAFFGTILGSILPTLIIVFGQIDTYALMAWILVTISLVSSIIFIPGVRDDKQAVETYLANYEKREKESLFKALKNTLKHKNFIIYLILILTYFSLMNTISASLLYYVRFVLNADASLTSLAMMLMFVGNLITVPLWYKFTNKIRNNVKTLLIGGTVMVIAVAFYTFFINMVGLLILTFFLGVGLGGFVLVMEVIFADVFDENAILAGRRREGLFSGVRFFITIIARVVQAMIFVIVHDLTGFLEGSDIQPATAIIGIQLHTGLIPALIMAVGLLIFWRFYDISPERSKQIKEQIIELNL